MIIKRSSVEKHNQQEDICGEEFLFKIESGDYLTFKFIKTSKNKKFFRAQVNFCRLRR